jgi:starch synthase (maltosyl-transferring)
MHGDPTADSTSICSLDRGALDSASPTERIGHADAVIPPAPKSRPGRIVIQDVQPVLDAGARAPKVTAGDTTEISATILRDGHEILRAVVRHRGPTGGWVETPMTDAPGTDLWHATLSPQELGIHEFAVEAWVDLFASWREEMRRRVDGGQGDLTSELLEGAAHVAAAVRRLRGTAKTAARAIAAVIASDAPQAERVAAALGEELAAAMDQSPERPERSRSPVFRLDIDRERATFGAWYELFPRSWGGFPGIEAALPAFAKLGIDVLYLTPIHPIGTTHRKGKNNTLTARPGEPGSPWAIGAAEGGHDAIHPDLGSLEDFDRLAAAAAAHDIELALDLAIQCSPDHPWLREHPEWFYRRPDGTLKYAENPPKKYQDIYNVNFDTPHWRALWEEIRAVVLHWCDHGVRIFRVDNPHTKPLGFWEWLIATVRAEHPETVFLAEAFTRPAVMYELGKVGFSQSYTYFAWRTGKNELQEYLTELARPDVAAFFRPNFFANTPDILHEYLQTGGPAAFRARLVLAATLGPSYGIYSGFEHFERVPVRAGSEEYLDSEKYETKRRRLDGPLLDLVGRLNAIRRSQPSLQRIRPLRFLETENDQLIAYAKGTGAHTVVCVVNLDPSARQVGLVHLPAETGLSERVTFTDLLTSAIYDWRVGGNYAALDPGAAHVMALRR